MFHFIITSILTISLISGSVTVVSAQTVDKPVDTLRIMTYNIHTGVGVDEIFDLGRIAELITDHNIDIVGLQEVDQGVERTDRVDTMKILREKTGMFGVFGRAIYFQGGEYGNGILSRFPILEGHNHQYTFEQTGEQRALLYITLKYNDHKILFMNTHLDHREDDNERMQSMEEILSIASDYEDIPGFIVGDINDTPDSRVVARLKENYVDVWEEIGAGPGLTFHTEDLNRRIDYIFYPDHSGNYSPDLYLIPIKAYTIQTPASDHLPVVAEFEVYITD